MSKRIVSFLLAVMLSGCGARSGARSGEPSPAPASPARSADPMGAFRGLEGQYSARLGIFAIDTGTGRTLGYRADERFAHCSTFKALLVGVLLVRLSDADLARVVHYSRADLLEYAPVTSQHVATGMSVRDLMAAAIEYSDNTAANLLLDRAGGPEALERQIRALGDRHSTVDREEPGLNDAVPGDVRDTSMPRDLALDLQRLVLGDGLRPERRAMLTGWLVGNTTGGPYVRAGVPAGWKVGDKTGSGGYGTRNDIAVVWPAGGAPIVVAIESDRGVADAASDDALIADATRIMIRYFR